MIFKEAATHNQFFNMLPREWQESILPFWETYKVSTKCYLLLDNEKPVVGGLVFSECPPDMLYAIEEANLWFKNGYLYLGFIFVLENRRGQNLGSLWLSGLKNTCPNQKYWLTVEDFELDEFYTKNGFKKIKSLFSEGYEEIIYCFDDV